MEGPKFTMARRSAAPQQQWHLWPVGHQGACADVALTGPRGDRGLLSALVPCGSCRLRKDRWHQPQGGTALRILHLLPASPLESRAPRVFLMSLSFCLFQNITESESWSLSLF